MTILKHPIWLQKEIKSLTQYGRPCERVTVLLKHLMHCSIYTMFYVSLYESVSLFTRSLKKCIHTKYKSSGNKLSATQTFKCFTEFLILCLFLCEFDVGCSLQSVHFVIISCWCISRWLLLFKLVLLPFSLCSLYYKCSKVGYEPFYNCSSRTTICIFS